MRIGLGGAFESLTLVLAVGEGEEQYCAVHSTARVSPETLRLALLQSACDS